MLIGGKEQSNFGFNFRRKRTTRFRCEWLWKISNMALKRNSVFFLHCLTLLSSKRVFNVYLKVERPKHYINYVRKKTNKKSLSEVPVDIYSKFGSVVPRFLWIGLCSCELNKICKQYNKDNL